MPAKVQAVMPGRVVPANDNGRPLTFISMFSGIEAASVAFKPLGWRAIAVAEIEKFPSAVLAHHYPGVPNVGDMTAHDWAQYHGKADIVCGGPPCQAFSVAGLRMSMQDARGNLSLAYMRALHAIKPRNAIIENVPGWLSTPDNAFGCFLAGLVGADDALCSPDGNRWPDDGMVAGPLGRAAWRILDAQHFGLAQRRRRVIVVADFGNGADPSAVLFERKSLQGDIKARRKAGEGTTGGFTGGADGGGGLGTDFDLDGGQVAYAPEIARCDATREGSSQDYETTTMVAVSVGGEIAHTLSSEGADASEGGTGRGTPIIAFQSNASATNSMNPSEVCPTIDKGKADGLAICFSAKDYGADAGYDIAPTLRSGNHNGSHANGGVMPAVAYMPARTLAKDGGVDERFAVREICDAIHTSSGSGNKAPMVAQTVAIRGRDGGATAELGGEVATALRASQGGGDKPHVLASRELAGAITSNYGKQLDNSDTALGPNVAIHHSAVRRLTPRECERLQGFQWLCAPTDNGAWQDDAGRWWSPDYTDIPWRGKPNSPDGPRYKALGNSWAVPKFAWIGRRIASLMPANDNNQTNQVAA